jgi:hypothetical protein
MDETGDHNNKQKKLDSERQISHFLYYADIIHNTQILGTRRESWKGSGDEG